MAFRTFKLTERAYIDGALREAGYIARFDDDVKAGGMTPGKTFVPCDEEGREEVEVVSRRGRRRTSADDIG